LIASCTGWLLDIYIEQDKAILWIKSEDKKILKLIDSSYQPFFYILPRNEQDGRCLFQTLSQQSIVKKVFWEENKFTNLFEEGVKNKLICVFPDSIQYYSPILKKLEKDYRVKQFFNTDLSHVQQYLFHRLKIEPTSKVEVEYDDGSRLIKLAKVNENEISPPPFSLLYVNVYTLSGNISSENQVMMIRTRYEEEEDSQHENEETFDNKEEKNILEEFCNYVQAKDPDIIIVSVGDHYVSTVLDCLFARMEKLGLDFLQLGREEENISKIRTLKHPGLKWIKGRLFISSSRNNHLSALDNFGLAGLIERCRFSFLTLDLAAKYSINRLIDSRNCYELIQRGFVIAKNNDNKGSSNNHEHIRTIEELVSRDKGGMIISPQIGLHENVVVLDYDSEYANLIVNHNLSYETILKGEEEEVSKSQGKKGLLPTVVEKYLKRRLYFKGLLKELPEESKEYLWCQQRIDSLKNILVCLYGTTSSLWNRYGNVLVFEEINKLSREVLIKTKNIVQNLGYELIYADTDSVFIKRNNGATTTTAREEEYCKVVDILRKETALPISIEHNYKFLVLLPLEANEKIEVLKQYYGITYQGELVVRGIEARRHDIPKFIKQFQTELLYTLFFDCQSVQDVINKGYENALLLVTKAIDKIMIGSSRGEEEEKEEEGGDITQDDLVISKELGQDIEKYKSLFPHVCAAIQLSSKSSNNGNSYKHPSKGDTIKYIYTDSQHNNPLCRVMPIEVSTQERSNDGGGGEEQRNEKEEQDDEDKKKNNHATFIYDKEKYREMILDAAETVLGYFGFDRTVYGNKRNKATRKWKWLLRDLKEEREKDIQIETMEK
jgi:DNA polymerase elongation subunit (family B)